MSVKERWVKAKANRLCFSCLSKGHSVKNCQLRKECSEEGCNRMHHGLLHAPKIIQQLEKKDATVYSAEAHGERRDVLFQIMPVIISEGGRSETIFAFIDHGSSHPMIEWTVVDKLGLQGKETVLSMQWLANVTSSKMSQQVDFQIKGCAENCKAYRMTRVSTVRDMSLPTQSATVPGLNYSEARPQLVIGLDHAHLTTPIAVPKTVSVDQPIVMRTKLGWVAYRRNNAAYVDSSKNKEQVFIACSVKRKLADMEQLMRDHYSNEDWGVMPLKNKLLSVEDQRAMRIMQEKVLYKDGRYEVGLLWKEDAVQCPHSYDMARRRLHGVETKIERNPEFDRKNREKIEGYIAKGYVRKLTEDEAAHRSQKTYYLPHFAVSNPNKNSLRVVFDAAAEVDGRSLNDLLLSGPDLNKPLLTILFKFRQGKIGICGDIREMFLQVAVRREDQDAQRFLWRNDEGKVATYAMSRMLFGAKCSPTLAQYVKNNNAQRHKDVSGRAVDAIVNHHYVDDYVHCFASESEAIDVVKQVISIHRDGGFEIRNFVSNSQAVLEALGDTQTKPDLVALDKADIERVLGMHWHPDTDQFTFVLKCHKIAAAVLRAERKPTKREVLAIVMSIFDPLGLLGHFVIAGKCLMQTLWKIGLQWDEEIPESLFLQWKCWLQSLDHIGSIKVQRCYHANIMSSARTELHVFADASESAMAAVAYFRISSSTETTVRFVFSKTRCAPLRYVSIPRLELQAAVLAVRLQQAIVQNHDVKIDAVYYWSDSTTVINWINSDSRRYKQYVANRIGEILEKSNANEWRWLPSSLNVADQGTRIKIVDIDTESRWIHGPEFLQLDEKEWPSQLRTFCDNSEGSELKTNNFTLTINATVIRFIDISRFSKFMKLVRCVALAMRFINRSRKLQGRNDDILTVEDLSSAEKILCRLAQKESWAEEYRCLTEGRAVTKKSPLLQLNPYIDNEGVIRLSGRIENAAFLSADAKRLIILPKEHQITTLIVRHYHERLRHINKDTIISEIRQKYWVPSLRMLVKRCEKCCNFCKIRRAQPSQPIMGLLPSDRVTPYVRPFSYTGLDYFGPIMVAVGRRREKRWVALFTCLTTRAVHLELALNLSADACLLTIRNFINRRGVPLQIHSDNGTNFYGLEKELHGEEGFIDRNTVAENLTNLGIRRIFNCPVNPSQGAAWERLVQSVKRALAMILQESAPRLETLQSALIEAENIVSSRPLTHLPLDSADAEPLTPNHFLLNTVNSTQTPGPDELKIGSLRKQWKIAQTLKNAFWKRWIAEYLPEMSRRTKWCQNAETLKRGTWC